MNQTMKFWQIVKKNRKEKNSKMMTRRRLRFWEPPRNNGRMAFSLKLRGWSPSLQATRRDSLLWTIPIIPLPIHNLLAFQTSSCVFPHRLSFSSSAPASTCQNQFISSLLIETELTYACMSRLNLFFKKKNILKSFFYHWKKVCCRMFKMKKAPAFLYI